MACYIVFPIMIALCAVSRPLIITLLTEKWLPAAPMLQMLCFAFLWEPIMLINHNMLNVKGRTDYFLYAEIIKKIVAVIILIATVPLGVYYMCAGLIIYSIADIIIIVFYSKKLTEISLYTQLKTLTPIFALSFSMGLLMFLFTLISSISPLIQLVLGFSFGAIYYLTISWFFHFKEFHLLLSAATKLIKKKKND